MPVQPDQPGGSQGAVISRTAPCLLPEMTHVSVLLLPTITLMRWKVPSILPHQEPPGHMAQCWGAHFATQEPPGDLAQCLGSIFCHYKSHLGIWHNAWEHILPHKSHLGIWRNAGERHQPCRRCHSRCSCTDSATSPCSKPSCHLPLSEVVQLIQLTDHWV